jgi:hypothetical protein
LWRLSKVSKNPKVGTSLSRSTILPEVYALFALDRNPEPRAPTNVTVLYLTCPWLDHLVSGVILATKTQ